MKNIPYLRLAAVALLLCASAIIPACTGGDLKAASNDLTAAAPLAAQITASTATSAQLADLAQACAVLDTAATGIAPIMQGGTKTTAALVANPGQAYCDQLSKTGKAPPNTDSNTAPWLAGLTAALNTLKALAPLASVAATFL